MIGATLGSYRVVADLGAGGMGSVWLAEHTLLGSNVAIKVLRPELSQSPHIVQRFFDEARAATRVNHPNIVTVFDFGWQHGSAYLVMEYLSGRTLTATIQQAGRLAPERALQITREAATAMAAAHAVGIIHRDLKPDNIFLVDDATGGERLKILDFGIAKLLGESDPGHHLTQTGMIMGTPAYMSPEQCRGAGRVDHRTDVYALGCVLFHLLTGQPPFAASTPGDLIASHLTAPPPAPSSVVPGLAPAIDALVLHCLTKDVAQRLETMTALVAAIDGLLGAPSLWSSPGSPVATGAAATPPPAVPATTMRSSVGEATIRPSPAWRGGLIVGALVSVGAVIAIVALLLAPRRSATRTAPADAGVIAGPDAAAIAPVDAAVVAPPIDAATDAGPATQPAAKKRPGTRPPRPGSGSAYDPFDDR